MLPRYIGLSLTLFLVSSFIFFTPPPASAQLNTGTPLILRPVSEEPGFGKGLAFGDVNGDGLDDIVVGSVLTTVNGLEAAGRVFLFLGGSFPPTPPSIMLQAPLPEAGARFGWEIDLADVNGDGWKDVIVSALFANGGVSNGIGEVHVFFGGPLFDTLVDITLTPPSALGRQAYFGWSVKAGDVNNDGVADIVVGAINVTVAGRSNAGEAYVYFGGRPFTGLLGTTLRALVPERSGDFGYSLAIADFNGDGIKDIAVGAPGQTAGGTSESGQVYIFLGGSPLNAAVDVILQQPAPESRARFGLAITSGDINDDGIEDLAAGATKPPFLFLGPQNRGEVYIFFGGPTLGSSLPFIFDQRSAVGLGSVLATGDVNRDGRSDIIAGVPATTVNSRRGAGLTLVFFGGPALDGLADIRLESPIPTTNELFGTSLATGDYNGDGRLDVAVGAIFVATVAPRGPGRVYLFLGQ